MLEPVGPSFVGVDGVNRVVIVSLGDGEEATAAGEPWLPAVVVSCCCCVEFGNPDEAVLLSVACVDALDLASGVVVSLRVSSVETLEKPV